MRCAILADIHANLAAFQAVLDHIKEQGGFDELWCLGDIVGYGPDPHECIELLRQYPCLCVAGNHDRAATGDISTDDFNPEAADAAHWTSQHISVEDKDFLHNLPEKIEKDDFTLVHGSPREPLWEYVLSLDSVRENFKYFNTSCCLIGHSHQPLLFRQSVKGELSLKRLQDREVIQLGAERLIINPGGVGQPRDSDPRAAYALYDSDAKTISLHRVAYDIKSVQQRMIQAGLPLRLVVRLSYGM
jgi:predicted phosphodiesterase